MWRVIFVTVVFSKADKRYLFVLVLMYALFFAMAWHYGCIYNGDSEEYVLMAKNISKGWLYAGDLSKPLVTELFTLRPPGYSLFMSLVYMAGLNDWAVLLLQNLIGIFNFWYLRKLLQRFGYHKQYDWLLILFAIAYPSQYVNANTITPDLLLQTTMLLFAGSLVMFLQSKQSKCLVYMSLWLIAGVMLKPVVLPVIYLYTVLVILAGIFIYKSVIKYAGIAVIPLLAVLLYSGFNQQRTGKFHFSSTQSFNAVFYYFNYYKDTKGADEALVFLQKERGSMAHIPDFAARYDYANARGKQLLKENLVGFVLYNTTHCLRMLIDPGKGELDMFTGRLTLKQLYNVHDTSGFYASYKLRGVAGVKQYIVRNPLMPFIMLVLLGTVLRLMGLLLFFANKQIDYRIRLFVFLFAGYFVFVAGAIAHVRYFMPVSLLVMGCAAIGWGHWLHRRRNKAIIASA